MSGSPVHGPLRRVGYHRAPVDFTPLDLYGFSHRFDDVDHRFRTPSRLDGKVCIALFEGRGTVHQVGDVVALTDPPPNALLTVTGEWKLKMQEAS